MTTKRPESPQLQGSPASPPPDYKGNFGLGVGCVGAPILDSEDHASAAISVSAPLARLQQLDIDAVGRLIAEHTAKLSRELGYKS